MGGSLTSTGGMRSDDDAVQEMSDQRRELRCEEGRGSWHKEGRARDKAAGAGAATNAATPMRAAGVRELGRTGDANAAAGLV